MTTWHVVRPIDPTHNDRDWLERLTADSGIPSDWLGLSHIEGWAARYPEVIDYYLRDGKERVNDQAMRFLAAAGMEDRVQSGGSVEPDRALEGLFSWAQALNRSDPHFRYEFATSPAPDNGEFVLPTADPELILSKILIKDGRATRLDVYERFNGAARERGEIGSISFIFQPRSQEERQAVNDFFSYGTPIDQIPIELPASQASAMFGLSESESVHVSVLPGHDVESRPVELAAVQDDGNRGPALALTMGSITRGIDGSDRWAWSGTDASGLVSIDMRVDQGAGTVAMTVVLGDVTGLRPREVLNVTEALAAMRSGTPLELRIPDGPPLMQLAPCPQDLASSQALQARMDLAQCLLTLQAQIAQPLSLPSLDQATSSDVKDWFTAAALLRGEVVWKTWASLGLTSSNRERLQLPAKVRTTRPLKVQLDGREWTVGLVDQQVTAAKWLPTEGSDGESGMLLPGEDTHLRLSLAVDAEARSRAESRVVQISHGDVSTARPESS